MAVYLVEYGVHQVRLFRAPIWCPSGGGSTREARGTVMEKPRLSDEYAPNSARTERSSIVDEPGEC